MPRTTLSAAKRIDSGAAGSSFGFYTGDKPERFPIVVLPCVKWVAVYGRLPDLPPHAFIGTVHR